jgi:hypothetical protein
MRTALRHVLLLATLAACLALPSSALAGVTVRYVDDSGNDTSNTNTCTSPSAPCLTIGHALSVADPGTTVDVGGGSYSENLSVSGGRSIVAADFKPPDTTGTAIVTSASATTIAVTTNSADTAETLIHGLVIRGAGNPVVVNGPSGTATISGNTFDSPNSPGSYVLVSNTSASSPTVSGNTFTDTSTTDDQAGVEADGTGAPRMDGNSFHGMLVAVDVNGGSAHIGDNAITGTHNGTGQGAGIRVRDATATITGNTIQSSVGSSRGILLVEFNAGPPTTGGQIYRNALIGNGNASGKGIVIVDTEGAVAVQSDLVAKWGYGLYATDNTGGVSTNGDTGVSDSTIFDNGTDVSNAQIDLTMDSSIVGDVIDLPASGNGNCTITFSRGPATPQSNGCSNYSTNADPMFVDPSTNDYHLKIGSPMVDAGNPAAPPTPSDIDGDNRSIDGNCDGTVRVDIGADELDTLGCLPPNTLFRHGSTGDTTRDRTPTFKFRANPNATGTKFRCKRDQGLYKRCTSPKTFANPFGLGRHVFRVKAISPFGVPDSSPAKQVFHVLP